MAMWKFSAREMKGRPGRAFLTLFSVVLGVAAVVSVTIATTTTRAAYKQMFTAMTGTSALEVSSEDGSPFSEDVVQTIEETPGVKAALSNVQGGISMSYDNPAAAAAIAEGKELDLSQRRSKVSLLAIGVDESKKESLSDYEVVAGGPITDDNYGVLLTEDFARGRQLKIDDEMTLRNANGTTTKLLVVGLLKPRGANVLNQGVVMLPLTKAQSLLGIKKKLNAVYVNVEDDKNVREVEAALNAKLPQGLTAHPPAARTQQADEVIMSSEQGLFLTSALSLAMAGFIIFNTFYMNVGERRRQLATMRALGATRKQVMNMLLREGLVLGLVGTILGTLLGIGGARLVTQAMEGVFQMELSALQLKPWVFALAFGFGMGISFLAALLPAYRAGAVSPLEGMRSLSTEELEGVPRWVTWCGWVTLAVSFGIFLACIRGYLAIDHSVAASIGILVGFALLIPLVLEPFTKAAGLLLRPFFHVESKLAVRQVLRRRVRGALTVGILFVAITFGIGVGNNMTNRVRDVKEWYRDTLVSDYFVRVTMPSQTTGTAPPMPPEVEAEIRKVPNIQAMDTIRYFSGKINATGCTVVAHDFTLGDKVNLQVRTGDRDQLREKLFAGEAAIGTVLAQRAKVQVGDTVTLSADGKEVKARIAATVNEYLAGGLVVHLATPPAEKAFDLRGPGAFAVKAVNGHRGDVEAALRKICDKHEIMLQSTAEITDMIDKMVGGIIGALWVTLALSFVVAAFGVVNTLTMNVLEQTREIGMLRVVAMTRNQVRRVILAQAAIVGVVGLAPGLVTGLFIAYMLNVIMLPVFGYSIRFDPYPMMIAECFFGGLLIILIAAWIPARRAAYLDLTTAMRRE